MLRRATPLLFALLLPAAILGGVAACGPATGTGGDGDGDGDGDVYQQAEDDVIAKVATFDTEGFTRVSAAPFPTQHAASDDAHVWITNAHVDDYKAIDPAMADQTIDAMPEGFIAVKEQYQGGDPEGRLLVMAKLPEDYNEDDADWWWGLFDDQDTPDQTGVVNFCINCHVSSGFTDTDYLGGVDPANQQ